MSPVSQAKCAVSPAIQVQNCALSLRDWRLWRAPFTKKRPRVECCWLWLNLKRSPLTSRASGLSRSEMAWLLLDPRCLLDFDNDFQPAK